MTCGQSELFIRERFHIRVDRSRDPLLYIVVEIQRTIRVSFDIRTKHMELVDFP